jgi:tetratricopeptide (TPR) repeat protein
MYPDFRKRPEQPELAGLMRKVESLGVSCELGLVQRHCAVESVGLFRFGYTPLDGLVRALEADLKDVGAIKSLRANQWYNLEYITVHRRYGFEVHTNHFADRIAKKDLLKKMSVHFGFLARKFLEELGTGEKLFVYRSENHTPSSEDALRLSNAMCRFGEPVLLWVELTDDPAKFGTVEWTVPGRVITGYLDWFAKTTYAGAMSFDYWVKLLQAAVALWEDMPGYYDRKLAVAQRAKADGDYGAAFEIWTELLGRFTDRPEAFIEASRLLCDLGQWDDAKALLGLGLARIPADSALLQERAQLAAGP